jgi:large subunit ribosomal protein L22
MARGAKLNEGQTHTQYVAGERHGTKATAKHVRFSATKARVVLDLVRGLPVQRADEVLQFTDRGAAHDVRKVLASAVANATDTNNAAYLGDADELFVLACFADEGATLRRFRPRARGRATRIRKRTCHITVVVARMSDQRLAIEQARTEGASATSAASRRARVERSRRRAVAARDGAAAPAAEADAEAVSDDALIEPGDTESTAAVQAFADVAETEPAEGAVDVPPQTDAEAAEESASDEAERREERSDEGAIETASFAPAEWEGSMLPDDDGNGPDTHPIKGNADSMLYHEPDGRYYGITKAEVWFDTAEHAEAAGFSKPASAEKSEETEEG